MLWPLLAWFEKMWQLFKFSDDLILNIDVYVHNSEINHATSQELLLSKAPSMVFGS